MTTIASTFEPRVIRDADGREIGCLFYPEIRLGDDFVGLRDPRNAYCRNDRCYFGPDRWMAWGPYPVIELSLSDGRTRYFLEDRTMVYGVLLNEPEALPRAVRQFILSGKAEATIQHFLETAPPRLRSKMKETVSVKPVFEELVRLNRLSENVLASVLGDAFEEFLATTAPAELWGESLEQVFASRHIVSLGNQRRHIEVTEAKTMKTGDVLLIVIETGICESSVANCDACSPTFQWLVGGGVGDGTIFIPAVRPKGVLEWKLYPQLEGLKKVSAEQWPVLLRALVGSRFDGFTVIDRLKEVREREVLQTQREARIRVVRESCFNGADFNIDNVSAGIGMRLLFSGTVRGTSIFIVDGVQDVALYIFRERIDAESWANGELPFKDARALAEFFTPHSEGWEERVRSYLRTR